MYVRPSSTDLTNVCDYMNVEIYEPPPEMRDGQLAVVWELGSNMGACLTAVTHR